MTIYRTGKSPLRPINFALFVMGEHGGCPTISKILPLEGERQGEEGTTCRTVRGF
jgi:hypothetical protein